VWLLEGIKLRLQHFPKGIWTVHHEDLGVGEGEVANEWHVGVFTHPFYVASVGTVSLCEVESLAKKPMAILMRIKS
jgi:hypothetical protein